MANTTEQRQEIKRLLHEAADTAVNFGGYADDPDEYERRSMQRGELEYALNAVVELVLVNRNKGV